MPFESLGAVSYSSSIVTVAVSVAVSEIFSVKECRDLEIYVKGHSRSLKMVPFESLGAVSYSSSIITMTLSCVVCEIFSVKARDLEIGVKGHSRSLEMARFDRPCTAFY